MKCSRSIIHSTVKKKDLKDPGGIKKGRVGGLYRRVKYSCDSST